MPGPWGDDGHLASCGILVHNTFAVYLFTLPKYIPCNLHTYTYGSDWLLMLVIVLQYLHFLKKKINTPALDSFPLAYVFRDFLF